jgi:hypothetical protein
MLYSDLYSAKRLCIDEKQNIPHCWNSSNRKIIERVIIDTPNTQLYDALFSGLVLLFHVPCHTTLTIISLYFFLSLTLCINSVFSFYNHIFKMFNTLSSSAFCPLIQTPKYKVAGLC